MESPKSLKSWLILAALMPSLKVLISFKPEKAAQKARPFLKRNSTGPKNAQHYTDQIRKPLPPFWQKPLLLPKVLPQFQNKNLTSGIVEKSGREKHWLHKKRGQ